MRRIYGIFAVVIASAILVVGLSYSMSPVEAQGATRQVEVKRVNMSSERVTTETLGVVVGISCLERNNGVECFVVSTR
jgi:hypothetical protein